MIGELFKAFTVLFYAFLEAMHVFCNQYVPRHLGRASFRN